MIEVNLIAIFFAALSNMILGYVWFTVLFGKTWPILAGMTEEKLKEMQGKGVWKVYALQCVGAFLMAFVLAHSLEIATHHLTNGNGSMDSVLASIEGAFSIWIGFILPVTLGAVLWQGKSWKLWAINSSFYLVSLLTMGVLLAAWS